MCCCASSIPIIDLKCDDFNIEQEIKSISFNLKDKNTR